MIGVAIKVTVLVEQLSQELQQRGGRPVFSVAVGADAEDAVTNRLQDWPNWVERRLVDAVVLMAYSADTERVAAHVQHAGMLGEGRRAGIRRHWRILV